MTIYHSDVTFGSAAENLAIEEALLRRTDSADGPQEWLRLWELATPCVVVGRGSRLAEEVNVDACRDLDIPILRRCSGGAAIAAAAGCLFYSVILRFRGRAELRSVPRAHSFVLGRIRDGLVEQGTNVELAGTSDLVVTKNGQRFKVSGNSLRVTRDSLLYHGSLLYRMDLNWLSQLLLHPPRQPDYRNQRLHAAFVRNLLVQPQLLRAALVRVWEAQPFETPAEVIREALLRAPEKIITLPS